MKPQYYVGVKMVFAYPEGREGRDGYAVVYNHGDTNQYKSWSPKAEFERSYFGIGDTREADAGSLLGSFAKTAVQTREVGDGTVVFVDTVSKIGCYMLSEKVRTNENTVHVGSALRAGVRQSISEGIAFVLRWARNGIQYQELPEVPKR